MNTEDLAAFVTKAMGINATTAGMGTASAGVVGMSSIGDSTVNELKRAVVGFATEYRKDSTSEPTQRLGKEIEGLLSTLQVMSVITDARCEQLTDDLHDLIEK
jgi:hypothetical protein